MKRRSQPSSKTSNGSYSRKVRTDRFMYGGYINHTNDPGRGSRRCLRKD